jgi:hypothetical protein
MDLSIFLSKVLGLYLVIISFAGLINANRFKALLTQTMENQSLLFVTGFMALIMGILMITSHNIWTYDWRVIITIAGWSAFLKGTLLVVFPQRTILFSSKWLQCKFAYYTTFLFTFVLGGYLCYLGTIHNQPHVFL